MKYLTFRRLRDALQRLDKRTVTALALLLVLDLAIFGDALISSAPIVPSQEKRDADNYFAPTREFAYAELAKGNVPLWNPYVFSGTPCLAACQAAVCYPPNLHYLVLPVAKAISLEIVIHIFLIGAFTFAWARYWKMPHAAATFAGVLTMFCGPYALRMFAGHMSLTSAWPWAVLALLCVDAYIDSRRLLYALIGAGALALAILAGHPQAAVEAGFVLTIYAALRCAQSGVWFRAVPGMLVFAIVPPLLAAIQFFPALEIIQETTRSTGMDYNESTSYSLPPENLLTAFAPFMFGDGQRVPYWGRWLLWEASAYVGITALALVGFGIVRSRERARWIWFGMAAFIVIITLGRYTPLFGILLRVVPGFDLFRGPGKFAIFAVMFIAMLTAGGARELLQSPRHTWPFAVAILGIAIAQFVLAFSVRRAFTDGSWNDLLSLLRPGWEENRRVPNNFLFLSAQLSAFSLLIAGASSTIVAILFGTASKWRHSGVALLAFGIIELTGFAWFGRTTVNLSKLVNTEVAAACAELPEGTRVMDRRVGLNLLTWRVHNAWGYDPIMLKRYRDFVRYTEEFDMESIDMDHNIDVPYQILAMVNCAYIVDSRTEGRKKWRAIDNPLPRFSFPTRVVVEPDELKNLELIHSEAFDPRDTVVLETTPDYAPSGERIDGRVTVIDESTDTLALEADVNADAVLLVADAYAKSWTIENMGEASQERYTLLPANHALRGIPMAKGHHVIRMRYAPISYAIGLWTTLLTVPLFLGVLSYLLWSRMRHSIEGSENAVRY